jgi:2-hydroxy fatty acid dioxygenase
MSLLTATAYSKNPDHVFNAVVLHGASWVAQFLAHGLAEKRAPALVDNLLGGMINKTELSYHHV